MTLADSLRRNAELEAALAARDALVEELRASLAQAMEQIRRLHRSCCRHPRSFAFAAVRPAHVNAHVSSIGNDADSISEVFDMKMVSIVTLLTLAIPIASLTGCAPSPQTDLESASDGDSITTDSIVPEEPAAGPQKVVEWSGGSPPTLNSLIKDAQIVAEVRVSAVSDSYFNTPDGVAPAGDWTDWERPTAGEEYQLVELEVVRWLKSPPVPTAPLLYMSVPVSQTAEVADADEYRLGSEGVVLTYLLDLERLIHQAPMWLNFDRTVRSLVAPETRFLTVEAALGWLRQSGTEYDVIVAGELQEAVLESSEIDAMITNIESD